MKKVKISIFFLFVLFALLFLSFSVFAAQTNSTNYRQNVVVSGGGENVSSPSYKMGVAIGIINRVINSSSYINRLGFFHTWLLANDQPCTAASQCEGGFCCSSLCKSSACPSGDSGSSGSSGGGGASSGGSGGGGGIAAPTLAKEPVKDFSASPSSIKERLMLGSAATKTIAIKNTGDTALSFDLSVATVNDFVLMSDTSFSLEPGQEKIVEANIIGKKLGSYFGDIEIKGDSIKKSVTVVVDVESEQALFDAKIDIPSAYKEVEAGGDLKAQITLLNVGPARKVDVTATYIIKDKRGNKIYESSETFAVDSQASFVKSFKVPENLQPGDYLAIIEIRYEKSFAVSSELFKVVEKEMPIGKTIKSNAALIAALIVFIVLMIFLFVYPLFKTKYI